MSSNRRRRYGQLSGPDGTLLNVGLVWEQTKPELTYRFVRVWEAPAETTEGVLLLDTTDEIRVRIAGRLMAPFE